MLNAVPFKNILFISKEVKAQSGLLSSRALLTHPVPYNSQQYEEFAQYNE